MSIKLFIISIILFLIDSIENNYINDFSLKEGSLKEKSLIEEFEPINYNNLDNVFSQKNLFFSENKIKYQELNDLSSNSKNHRDIITNSSFTEIPDNVIYRFEDKYQHERRFKIIRTLEKKQDNNFISHPNQNSNKESNNNFFKNLGEDEDEYFSDKHNFYGNKKNN